MRGRLSAVIAGLALAIGGGVAGAVVVAPSLQSDGDSIAVQQAAEKKALASLQHTFHVAKKARGMARGARQLANGLVADVNQAQSDASQALSLAGAASSRIDATRIASAMQGGRVTTDQEANYVSLGGPSLTVDVPSSGYIEVWVSARIGDETDGTVDGGGAVALFEDGQLVPIPNQQSFCTSGSPTLDDALVMGEMPPNAEATFSTPPVPNAAFGCGSAGAVPGSLVFKRPPGTHTYELRYGDCGCFPGTPAAFSDRLLQVAPRL